MKHLSRSALLAMIFLICGGSALATEGSPVSFQENATLALEQVATHDMPPVDVERLLLEDAANRNRKDIPYRIGYPQASDLEPVNSGTWEELPGGGSLWRLKVRSPGARWLVLGFGTFRLQPGAQLFVYDLQRERAMGPYTSADIRSHGQLWFPPLTGETVVVELYWPPELSGVKPQLHLGTVSHGYKNFGPIDEAFSEIEDPSGDELAVPNSSGSCNIDVNCPLGDNWQDQKHGVVRLLSGGSAFCTGSLINTTADDCRPYVLTARHCLSSASAAAGTTIQFNYERSGCGGGTTTTSHTVTGATLRATYSASDVTLIEMDEDIPPEFSPYFSGWNNLNIPASESWGIHHPSCDYKKISYNSDPLIDGPGGTGYGADHWRVTEWEMGTTEPCSSGSPIFDQDQRIVGQLHGGYASCSNITWDEYGKVAISWNGGGTASTRLRDWLDPDGTGATAISGIDLATCLVPAPILDYSDHSWTAVFGNGDAGFDPGEGIALEIGLENTGKASATDVRGVLSSSTPLVSIGGNPGSWPEIPEEQVKSTTAPHFDLQLDPAYPCGTPIQLSLETSSAESVTSWISNFEIATGVPAIAEHFRDEFESGSNGWTSISLNGSGSWTQVSSDSTSPSHSWHKTEPVSRQDTALVMPTLTSLPPGSLLRFMHRFNTEANRDGGVLEYSTNGGASWLDAAPLFVTGGYNSSIGSGETTALAGRMVWSGDSGGWQSVTLDLSSLSGTNLQLRWRFATNFFIADEGWYLDDVIVDSTSFSCVPLLNAPGEASAPSAGDGPFLIDRAPGGFELNWSAPSEGGAAIEYSLYRMPLAAVPAASECEANLGSGTSSLLPALTTDSGFMVVGKNSLGEGSYGFDGQGGERSPAVGGDICP